MRVLLFFGYKGTSGYVGISESRDWFILKFLVSNGFV